MKKNLEVSEITCRCPRIYDIYDTWQWYYTIWLITGTLIWFLIYIANYMILYVEKNGTIFKQNTSISSSFLAIHHKLPDKNSPFFGCFEQLRCGSCCSSCLDVTNPLRSLIKLKIFVEKWSTISDQKRSGRYSETTWCSRFWTHTYNKPKKWYCVEKQSTHPTKTGFLLLSFCSKRQMFQNFRWSLSNVRPHASDGCFPLSFASPGLT